MAFDKNIKEWKFVILFKFNGKFDVAILKTRNGKLEMVNGEWGMWNGKSVMENGEWEWGTGNGESLKAGIFKMGNL